MVDVGYFIDGKHGVIRNVMPISNTKTEHLCFVSCLPNANGEEQYALKKEDIEYVIPSVNGKIVFDKDGVIEYSADGSVVMKGKYFEGKNLLPPKPMTFAEKFKEVFGFEVNRNVVEDVCSVVNCSNMACDKCPYHDRYNWDDPYEEVKDD